MTDLVGHDIGRYHIVEQLGQGGMAIVYKAYDTRLDRDVAIKIIRMENFAPAVAEHTLKRFEREAKSLARLDHPNIIPIHDYGEHDGSPYLVMKYIPGGTLKAQTGSPLPFARAARLLVPVARALEYAHSLNIIHRDVKPANILITAAGEPMLSDFGVAKILESDEGNTLTGANVGVGTPEYMAPEQWENQVSPQTDVYALGVVFYELVTGQKPYTADTPAAVLRKQLLDPLPRPAQLLPGLPEAVEKVIYKALAKTPEARYASMGEFAGALEKLAAQAGLIPPPAPLLSAIPPEAAAHSRQTQRAKPAPVRPPDTDNTLDQLAPTPPPPPKLARPFSRKGWIGLAGGLGVLLLGAGLLALLAGGFWLAGKMAAPAPTESPGIGSSRISDNNPFPTTPTPLPTNEAAIIPTPNETVTQPDVIPTAAIPSNFDPTSTAMVEIVPTDLPTPIPQMDVMTQKLIFDPKLNPVIQSPSRPEMAVDETGNIHIAWGISSTDPKGDIFVRSLIPGSGWIKKLKINAPVLVRDGGVTNTIEQDASLSSFQLILDANGLAHLFFSAFPKYGTIYGGYFEAAFEKTWSGIKSKNQTFGLEPRLVSAFGADNQLHVFSNFQGSRVDWLSTPMSSSFSHFNGRDIQFIIDRKDNFHIFSMESNLVDQYSPRNIVLAERKWVSFDLNRVDRYKAVINDQGYITLITEQNGALSSMDWAPDGQWGAPVSIDTPQDTIQGWQVVSSLKGNIKIIILTSLKKIKILDRVNNTWKTENTIYDIGKNVTSDFIAGVDEHGQIHLGLIDQSDQQLYYTAISPASTH